jgi:hypothetical protein
MNKLDRVVWLIGERVPWWVLITAPLLVLAAFPDNLATRIIALVVGWAAMVIVLAHRAIEHRLATAADLWVAADQDHWR